jgi:hypothetical protein
MKKFFVLGMIFLLAGCAAYMDIAPKAQPGEEAAYLKEAVDTPLVFTAPKDKSDEIWGRINAFIGKYSSMKIQTASNYIIETFNPSNLLEFGYSANRAPKGDDVEFTVSCFTGVGSKNIPTQNAHLLAYYALTGKIIPRLIVQ